VSRYPDARRVAVTYADLRRLTILERARACAIANVGEEELGRLVDAVTHHEGTPADLERGSTLFYAMALQLERRLEPGLTWEDAQTWNVELDLEQRDEIADAEARASVDAAIATGLPPAVAGELTLAQLDAYREHADDIAKRRRRRGKRSA
jgi:hypothetical protein